MVNTNKQSSASKENFGYDLAQKNYYLQQMFYGYGIRRSGHENFASNRRDSIMECPATTKQIMNIFHMINIRLLMYTIYIILYYIYLFIPNSHGRAIVCLASRWAINEPNNMLITFCLKMQMSSNIKTLCAEGTPQRPDNCLDEPDPRILSPRQHKNQQWI